MAKIIRVISTILSSKIRRQIIPVYIITTAHSAQHRQFLSQAFTKLKIDNLHHIQTRFLRKALNILDIKLITVWKP